MVINLPSFPLLERLLNSEIRKIEKYQEKQSEEELLQDMRKGFSMLKVKYKKY